MDYHSPLITKIAILTSSFADRLREPFLFDGAHKKCSPPPGNPPSRTLLAKYGWARALVSNLCGGKKRYAPASCNFCDEWLRCFIEKQSRVIRGWIYS